MRRVFGGWTAACSHKEWQDSARQDSAPGQCGVQWLRSFVARDRQRPQSAEPDAGSALGTYPEHDSINRGTVGDVCDEGATRAAEPDERRGRWSVSEPHQRADTRRRLRVRPSDEEAGH